jgi:hypothetical protein
VVLDTVVVVVVVVTKEGEIMAGGGVQAKMPVPVLITAAEQAYFSLSFDLVALPSGYCSNSRTQPCC